MNQMKTFSVSVLVAIFLCVAHTAGATAITFTSQTTFDAAAPGLSLETFQSGLVTAGAVTICTGPLSNAFGSTCFSPGSLTPDVSYSSSGGTSPTMALLGANFSTVGNTSKVLGPNAFADTLNLTFTGAPNAAGFDVFAGPAAGNVLISLFSPTNVALDSFTITAPLGGTFFGFILDTGTIGRVNIASLAGTPGELIDNLEFGSAAVSPSAVPEPTSLVLLGSGLVVAARRYRRRTPSK